MKRANLSHYAISSCVIAALLAGCGGSQPPIGTPGATPQGAHRESTPYARASLGQTAVGQATGVEFAYVANYFSHSVSAYQIEADGALAPVKGSPFAAGSGPISVAIDPTGKFIYAANQSGSYSTISGYTIDLTSGALTPIKGSPFASSFNSDAIAIDPTGRFAYVTNYGNESAGYVSAYTINRANGALTQVKGSPFGAAVYVCSVVVDPTGKFVYAGVQTGFTSYSTPTIYAYVIDRGSGALKPVHGSPFPAGGIATSMAVDPTGRHLYSVDGKVSNSDVFGFNVKPNSGALTPMKGSPFSTGEQASFGIAVEPRGRFAYVSDNILGTGKIGKVSGYKIERGGVLEQVTGSPFVLGKNTHPLGVAVDPSGKFLYITEFGRSRVAAYRIQRDGALTPVKGSPSTAGQGPKSVATCRVTSGKCVPPPL